MNQFKVNDLTVTIKQDHHAEIPRNDEVAICYRNSSRYTLGTVAMCESDLHKQEQRFKRGEVYALPVFAYIHGSIQLSTTPFSCPWDSGCSGIAIASKREFKDEAEAHRCIRSLIEQVNQYLNGDVWGYVITDEEGNELESCWEMFGIDYCKEEATATASILSKELESSTYSI
jgi:hypothetical protein